MSRPGQDELLEAVLGYLESEGEMDQLGAVAQMLKWSVREEGRIADWIIKTAREMATEEELPLLAERLLAIAQTETVPVEVTAAVSLTEEQKRTITGLMKERLGRPVDLIQSVDPSIGGGLVIRTGDRIIDLSVSRRLNRLREELLAVN